MLLALAVTVSYFIVAFVFPFILRRIPNAPTPAEQRDGSEHD